MERWARTTHVPGPKPHCVAWRPLADLGISLRTATHCSWQLKGAAPTQKPLRKHSYPGVKWVHAKNGVRRENRRKPQQAREVSAQQNLHDGRALPRGGLIALGGSAEPLAEGRNGAPEHTRARGEKDGGGGTENREEGLWTGGAAYASPARALGGEEGHCGYAHQPLPAATRKPCLATPG